MPSDCKFNKGFTRYIQRDYLSGYLGKEHSFRPNKSNLAKGLESNFSNSDIQLVIKERENLNIHLIEMIDIQKIDTICNKFVEKNTINEEDIINFQIFLNTNIFLNSFFK